MKKILCFIWISQVGFNKKKIPDIKIFTPLALSQLTTVERESRDPRRMIKIYL